MSIWNRPPKVIRTFMEKCIANQRISLPLRRENEINLLRALRDIPWEETRPTGVLLADQIEDYANKHNLIHPFYTHDPRDPKKTKLRAAGYELSVGEVCSKGGEIHYLEDEIGKDSIVINPFEVVVIQTLERLNMPEFLIGRWNVAVGKAYEGLLWVGAAQVDPGFKGYLCCPIYNLSNKPCTLKYGESIAVIDFVTTTPPTARSKEFKFDAIGRKRLLFEDYETLNSALTNAQDRLDKADREIVDLRATVAVSNGVILAALGALVTALALFVSGNYPGFLSRFSPALWVSLAALIVSFLSLILASIRAKWWRYLALWLVVLAAGYFLYWYANKYPLPNPEVHQTSGQK